MSRFRNGPLFLSFVLLTGLLVFLYREVIDKCDGHFGYPMDDTYIHMAMARSFSQYGVWGLTHYSFSSTSSSLLYTALLSAVYAVAGVSDLAPFLLNVLFAFLLLYLFDYVLRQAGTTFLPRAGLLALVVFGTPLAPEVMAGMEHILHAILIIAFVYAAVRLLTGEPSSRIQTWGLLALAALTVLARYESLAIVAVSAALFFLRGKRVYGIALFSSASIPVALFGLYSVHKGWFPVPNSIVAKASRPEKSLVPYPIHWAEQLYATPSVAFLFIAGIVLLYLVYARKRTIWTVGALTLSLFIGTTLLHMQFARVGWFYRYEVYLVILGVYACALGVRALDLSFRNLTYGFRRPQIVYASFLILAALSFESRAVGALWLTPWACRNIYEQQYQMGRFLKQSYTGQAVLMNDIGAAGYLSEARIVDLYGLSTIEVARAKIHHQFTQEFRRSLSMKTNSAIAIVYPDMYRNVGGLPPEWIKVGSWAIRQNQVCWENTVSFYAIKPAYKDGLIANLREFGPLLPPGVIQFGLYTKSGSRTD